MNYSHSVSVKPQQPHSTIQTETAMMILRSINGYIQARVIGLSLHTVCIFLWKYISFLAKVNSLCMFLVSLLQGKLWTWDTGLNNDF